MDASCRLLAECQHAGMEGFGKGLPRSAELDMLPNKRDITVSFCKMREAWMRGWDEALSAHGSQAASLTTRADPLGRHCAEAFLALADHSL